MYTDPTLVGQLGTEPLDEPEVDASRLHEDVVMPGVGIDVLPTTGPDQVAGRDPVLCSDPAGTRPFRTQVLTGNVAMLFEDADDWRREVTLTGIGTAAQIEIAHRPDFLAGTFIGAGMLPLPIPLQPKQSLWIRQNSGITQNIDGWTEPLGPGR